MGCDIHLYHERRKKGSPVWEPTHGLDITAHQEHLEDLKDCNELEKLTEALNGPLPAKGSRSERDYHAFARLGMAWRVHTDHALMIKDLPEDVSPAVYTAAVRYGEDGHNHSWTTLAEILRVSVESVLKSAGDMKGDLADYISELERLEREQPEYEHRIVFWFDN